MSVYDPYNEISCEIKIESHAFLIPVWELPDTIIMLDNTNALHYYCNMIKSFHSKETEIIWRGDISKKLPFDIQRKARMKMRIINNSISLNDLKIPPSNRLESLKGDRKGKYSIRINDQWRICFEWTEGNAYNLEIIDYH